MKENMKYRKKIGLGIKLGMGLCLPSHATPVIPTLILIIYAQSRPYRTKPADPSLSAISVSCRASVMGFFDEEDMPNLGVLIFAVQVSTSDSCISILQYTEMSKAPYKLPAIS